MDLSERIIAYITNHHPISYSKIVQVAAGKGFNEYDVTEALSKVHKDKRIVTKTRKDEIWYDLVTIKEVQSPTHHSWLRTNYPPMTPDNDGSVIDIDLSYLFMSPDEAKEYKAAAKGVPTFMYNKRNAKEKRQITRE